MTVKNVVGCRWREGGGRSGGRGGKEWREGGEGVQGGGGERSAGRGGGKECRKWSKIQNMLIFQTCIGVPLCMYTNLIL